MSDLQPSEWMENPEKWHCTGCDSVLGTETLREIGLCGDCIRANLQEADDE